MLVFVSYDLLLFQEVLFVGDALTVHFSSLGPYLRTTSSSAWLDCNRSFCGDCATSSIGWVGSNFSPQGKPISGKSVAFFHH